MAGISILNDLNSVPIREGRQATGTLTALNATVTLPVNGDQTALVFVNGLSPALTVVFEGSGDGVNYIPLPAIACYGLGGTLPNFAQPLTLELYAVTWSYRVYQVRCANFRYIRVRASTYTSGAAEVTINADANDVTYRNLDALSPTTGVISITGAAGAAVTATAPAVTGLRHYITGYRIDRLCTTAVATALATPLLTTAANHSVVHSFPNPVEAVGNMISFGNTFDGGGLAATAAGTATSFTAPASANHLYRINLFYRLGV